MKRRGLVAVLIVSLRLGGVSVFSDEATSALAPGARVRVDAPSSARDTLVGTLLGMDDQVLRLRLDDRRWNEGLVRIPVTHIKRLEVYQAQPGRNTKKGALIGAGVGLALDLAAAASVGKCSGDCYGGSGVFRAYFLPLVGAGTLLGAGLGALSRRHRWEPVSVAGARVGFAVAPAAQHGWRASFSVRF